MKTTTLFCAVIAGLFLVAGCGVTAAGTGSCTQSYLIQLNLAPSGVTEKAVQLVYGYSPLANQSAGTLDGRVLAADGRVLSAYTLWDPRIQLGEDITLDRAGNITVSSKMKTYEETTAFVVMFPSSAEAKAFSLYDEKGRLMKTVDLSKAENRATGNCTPDYGIPLKKTTGGSPGSLPVLTLAGVLVLVVAAAGAGWYLLKKKKGTG